ncbi:putative zinc-finger [Bellilinea caldifistulae]|mgnify:CR=1 FL=1|jgi:anti-sigma factor (TIGR02949 family)|nr:zf-HC2 domain-containing protein [Bellilinea caldifistulae]GAP10241.1 putative zinc-finger [Bellilinea caldifistulae]
MSDHLDCQQLLSSISDFVDGELNPELCRQIEQHLTECENCRIVINTLRKTIDLYQHQPGDEGLPQEIRHRLFHRLHLEEFLNRDPG